MSVLVLLYSVLTLTVAGNMVYRGEIWAGIALLIGSIIGFAAGSGARGGTYLGQRKSALIIGVVLLIVGMALPFYLDVTLQLFGINVAGDTWVGLGAVIGWFAARPEDAGASGAAPLTAQSERTLVNDSDWCTIDGEACRVIEFTPFAKVENGEVTAVSSTLPYASVTLECPKLPPDSVGYITHKMDFQHLWAAFMDRGVGQDEEAIIFWSKKHLKASAKAMSTFMPRLWVTICKKGAYELMTVPESSPELRGQARFHAERPIVDWKPEVMD